MFKKLMIIALCVSVMGVFVAGGAFAATNSSTTPTKSTTPSTPSKPSTPSTPSVSDTADGVYTVASAGSTSAVSSFKMEQKPWLFVKAMSQLNPIPQTQWTNPSNGLFTNTSTLAGNNGFWLSFSDQEWKGATAKGKWTVNATDKLNGVGPEMKQLGSANFVVTPEPIGSALFLIGAGALGLIKRSRNKSRA